MKILLFQCIACLWLCNIVGCSPSINNSSSRNDNKEKDKHLEDCIEPENPYFPGSGHYAGFEWAEQNDPSSCGANSQSFTEGCEQYQIMLAAHEECVEN